MKKHLRILYGADDRFQIVKDTVEMCDGYFDSTRIVNCGPEIFNKKLENSYPKNCQIEHSGFFCGDLESCRNLFLYDVDIGDWVLWLDADERPSQLFLDNMDNLIKESEKRSVFLVKMAQINHYFVNEKQENNWVRYGCGEDGNWDFLNPSIFAQNSEQYGEHHHKWNQKQIIQEPLISVCRFFRKLSEFASADTNFGGHGQILNYREDIRSFYSPYPINHIKHEIMVYQSGTTCIYFNPSINANSRYCREQYLNSEEYSELRKFQKKTNVKTQNDLCYKLHLEKDLEFKQKFKILCESELFEKSNLESNLFKTTPKIWSVLYDVSWETPQMFCGKNCCKYKNKQL